MCRNEKEIKSTRSILKYEILIDFVTSTCENVFFPFAIASIFSNTICHKKWMEK